MKNKKLFKQKTLMTLHKFPGGDENEGSGGTGSSGGSGGMGGEGGGGKL